MRPVPGRRVGPPRSVRRRDGQQWLLDWVLKTPRRVQNFERDEALDGWTDRKLNRRLYVRQAGHRPEPDVPHR
jgi:hypothetical protein